MGFLRILTDFIKIPTISMILMSFKCCQGVLINFLEIQEISQGLMEFHETYL